MKTAVSVLQELMIRLGDTAEYECVAQTGPPHLATFEYRCAACGATVTAAARSKKEAKQEAARLLLLELARRGLPVPAPYAGAAPCAPRAPCAPAAARALPGPLTLPQHSGDPGQASAAEGAGAGAGAAAHSYVALLKEMCSEYRLPACEFALVGDTGPPHLRHFTVRASLLRHQRLATATSKKAARQLAAEQLYRYLRENLARLTKDFVEEEALARAHEKAMERYEELRDDAWRPDLGQRVADYHLGLLTHIGADERASAQRVLEAWDGAAAGAEPVLAAAAAALGLGVTRAALSAEGGTLSVVSLAPACPALAAAARDPGQAAARALNYLRLALRSPRAAY